jgi:hypothetical protein
MIQVDTSTTSGPDGSWRSVWDILVDKCQAIHIHHKKKIHTCTYTYIYIYMYILFLCIQAEVDMSSDKQAHHSLVFATAAAALRKLRGLHADYIVDVILLVLPKLEPVLGTCTLLPLGLGSPAMDVSQPLTECDLQVLLSTLDGTAVFEAMKEGGTQEKKKKAIAKAQASQPKARGKKSKPLPPADSESPLALESRAHTFLHHLDETLNYLLKIDKRQWKNIEAMKFIALKAALTGVATVSARGVLKPVKGWSSLRVAFKDSFI